MRFCVDLMARRGLYLMRNVNPLQRARKLAEQRVLVVLSEVFFFQLTILISEEFRPSISLYFPDHVSMVIHELHKAVGCCYYGLAISITQREVHAELASVVDKAEKIALSSECLNGHVLDIHAHYISGGKSLFGHLPGVGAFCFHFHKLARSTLTTSHLNVSLDYEPID